MSLSVFALFYVASPVLPVSFEYSIICLLACLPACLTACSLVRLHALSCLLQILQHLFIYAYIIEFGHSKWASYASQKTKLNAKIIIKQAYHEFSNCAVNYDHNLLELMCTCRQLEWTERAHEGVKECFGFRVCVCTSFKTKCISIFAHYVHVQQIPFNKNGDNSSSNDDNDDNDEGNQNDFAKHENRIERAANVIFALRVYIEHRFFISLVCSLHL